MAADDEGLIASMRLQAYLWSGAVAPDQIAEQQVAMLCDTWRGLVNLRGTLSFEEQPADFDRALRICQRKLDV